MLQLICADSELGLLLLLEVLQYQRSHCLSLSCSNYRIVHVSTCITEFQYMNWLCLDDCSTGTSHRLPFAAFYRSSCSCSVWHGPTMASTTYQVWIPFSPLFSSLFKLSRPWQFGAPSMDTRQGVPGSKAST
jgi:hypothetical protein